MGGGNGFGFGIGVEGDGGVGGVIVGFRFGVGVEEDLALKQQLELYVERVHDSDRGVQKLARESIRECQNSISSNGACMNVAVNVGGFATVYTTNANRMEGRRLKAFWDTLRSISIEIESIERVEELEEILSRSKKLSQSIPIDCLACMDLDLYTTLLRMSCLYGSGSVYHITTHGVPDCIMDVCRVCTPIVP